CTRRFTSTSWARSTNSVSRTARGATRFSRCRRTARRRLRPPTIGAGSLPHLSEFHPAARALSLRQRKRAEGDQVRAGSLRSCAGHGDAELGNLAGRHENPVLPHPHAPGERRDLHPPLQLWGVRAGPEALVLE